MGTEKNVETKAAESVSPLCVEEVSMPDAVNDPVASTEDSAAATATPKSCSETASTPTPQPTTRNAPLKKKKKKKNYKNMMASMMQQTSSRDDDKNKDAAIRKVTGGGAFSKID